MIRLTGCRGVVPCRALALAIPALFGCRGATYTPEPSTPTYVPAAAWPSAVPTPQSPRPLQRADDYVDREAPLLGHLDARKLREGRLYSAYRELVEKSPMVAARLTVLSEKCGFDPIEAVDEVAVSAPEGGQGPNESEMVIAVVTHRSTDELLACVLGLAELGQRATLDGRPAVDMASSWMVAEGQVALFGPKQQLHRVLSTPRAKPAAQLPAGDYLAYRPANPEHGLRLVRASLNGVGPAVLELRAECTTQGALTAMAMVLWGVQSSVLTQLRESHLVQPVRGQLERILQGAPGSPEAMTLSVVFSVSDEELSSLVTNLAAALAVYDQTKAADLARAERAKNQVGEIAAALKKYAEIHGRFPPTAPRVPKQIPKTGQKVSVPSSAWEHRSWKAIGFRVRGAQDFSYEFETSVDGKQVEIRALDEDDGVQPRGVGCWRSGLSFARAWAGEPVPRPRQVNDPYPPDFVRPCDTYYYKTLAKPAGGGPKR